MADKASISQIILSQSAPDTSGTARVDLRKKDFDALIWGKSYEVYIDKSIKCPCRNVKDAQALSSCRNCGGSGWLYINRRESRVTIQSMNIDTKFKEWSEELMGSAKITFLNKEHIQWMDRVVIRNATMGTQQTLFPQRIQDRNRVRTIYPIISIEEIFLFLGTDQPLKRLTLGEDYVIENQNWIILNDQYLNLSNPTISVRYRHNPQYYILELTRSVMTSTEESSGVSNSINLPLSAVSRLCHYVIDEQNYNNDYLLDNSYLDVCGETVTVNLGGNICSFNSYEESNLPQTPSANIIVFNTTQGCFQGWSGTEWLPLGSNLLWDYE